MVLKVFHKELNIYTVIFEDVTNGNVSEFGYDVYTEPNLSKLNEISYTTQICKKKKTLVADYTQKYTVNYLMKVIF